jgi:transposase
LREEVRDHERQLVVLQSELKEKNVMQRLKYTEALQTVAELKQQMAQLESKVKREKLFLQLKWAFSATNIMPTTLFLFFIVAKRADFSCRKSPSQSKTIILIQLKPK